jgi:hypothetical protein
LRDQLLNSISDTISDYRKDEISIDSDHVNKWVCQFNGNVQLPILQEMTHVLKKTYFSLNTTKSFLERIFNSSKLVGSDPCAFWRRANLLDLQQNGNSQREMLALLNKIINKNCDIQLEGNDHSCSEEFIYLDDGLFSGNTVLRDLSAWIATKSPKTAKVHVVTVALHTSGRYYAENKIYESARNANKTIELKFWPIIQFEDRKKYTDYSDVLRPCSIPEDPAVKAHVNRMSYKPHLRKPGQVGNNKIFSSDEARQLLEREFLVAGVKIRGMCPNLNEFQHPLGNSRLETLGFGSLFVTFRNCANNAPLALWAGHPWEPLFPRKTNTDASLEKFRDMLEKTNILW